jgi:hypothetical protein
MLFPSLNFAFFALFCGYNQIAGSSWSLCRKILLAQLFYDTTVRIQFRDTILIATRIMVLSALLVNCSAAPMTALALEPATGKSGSSKFTAGELKAEFKATGASVVRDPWLNGFPYRMPITITNSGSALSNYQSSVTVNTSALISAGKMQPGCQDIRFTGSDGISNLYYWIESGTNTASTKIWVKVPSIPASPATTIYMYYGNPSATSASNGTNIFIEWKNMETDPFTTYATGDGATHQISTAKVKEGTYSAYHDLHDAGKIGFSTSVGATKKIIEFWYYKITPTSRDNDATFHLTNAQGAAASGAMIYYSSTGGISWYDGLRR